MKLAEIGVKQPVATAMVFLAILIIGLVSLNLLPLDLMPDFEQPAITVVTPWPGTSTEDVETKVTRIIENDLSIVNNLDEITSTTREGLSSVTCRFDWDANLDEAANDIRDRLEFSKRRLPEDIDEPMVFKFNTSMMPILFCGVTADESWEKLSDLIEDEVADPLKRLPGVGAVTVFGGLERQINIELDRARLAAYGLTLDAVEAALRSENLSLPAGSVKAGALEYTIRVPGEYSRPEQIRDIPVKRSGGAIVYLRDVAQVGDLFKEVRRVAEINGRTGMMMIVQKRSGANTVKVCEAVRAEIEQLKTHLPRDIDMHFVMDSSEFIRLSIRNVSQTVLWGGLFVVLTTLFFLRNIRASATILMTIPFSMIISFTFMFLMGWTLNIISLAALSIAIGMVVDNSVVVQENISSHAERGGKIREAAMFGCEEVGLAISASTLTTVVVFFPLIFISGLASIFFTQLGGIVTVTLLASLLCALWLTPMLASKLLRPPAVERAAQGPVTRALFTVSERGFTAMENAYEGLLAWALRHRPVVLLLAVAALSGSIVLVPLIGTEFSPEQDSGDLTLTMNLPVGTRVEVTTDTCRRAIALARSLAGEENIQVSSFRCGESTSGGFGGVEGSHIGRLMLKLVPMDRRARSSKDIGREIADRLREWPQIEKLSVSTANRLDNMMGGGGKPISIDVLGHDMEVTDRIAARIRELAQDIPGARDITLSRDQGNPEIAVHIDRARAAALGLNITRVVESLRTLFYGTTATKYREGENEYDVFMQLQEPQRGSISDLLNSEIVLPDGRRLRLDSFATVEETRGPVMIERKNQERTVKVEMDTYGRTVGEIVNDLKTVIAREVDLPQGVGIEYGGMVREQGDSFRALGMMLALGIVLVFMVMAGQFESLLDPFIIMFSVPFAFTGVALALWLSGSSLSIMSFIGMILLVGTVVNNAIVLIDYTNLLRLRGESMADAIRHAGRSRLRPVLITTLTTVGGMAPLAFGGGVGSEGWRPMGLTVIGGLLVSTLITLVLVPVLFSLFNRTETRPAGPEGAHA